MNTDEPLNQRCSSVKSVAKVSKLQINAKID
jgi:hypothetical protein